MTVTTPADPGVRPPSAARRRLLALRSRLEGAAAALGVLRAPDPEGTDAGCAELLEELVARLSLNVRDDEVWLFLVAVTGTFPTPEAVEDYRRTLRLADQDEAVRTVLSTARESGAGALERTMVVIEDRPVVDVDFTARHDLQTGIQRVVRQTLPRWHRQHELALTAWTDDGTALRELVGTEQDRVLCFRPAPAATPPARYEPAPRVHTTLVVPWHTTLVLPEVPRAAVADRLRAATTANRVVAIGYDCIPVVSADTVDVVEPVKFVRYLSLLKHADVVVAISAASAEEFAGFADMLPTQGLSGPRVEVCRLPVDATVGSPDRPVEVTTVPPRVLVVGSHDPRKNHLAVLHAAERLWLDGLVFSVVFVGGRGWRAEGFEQEIVRLSAAGYDVRAARGVDDEELWGLYDSARFSVFVSLHEGYGLPVAESLARGVPVLTSDRGSMAEIARDGGAVTVDPLDDEALCLRLRELLVDDQLVDRLAAEARAREPRSWHDYAEQLWLQVCTDGSA